MAVLRRVETPRPLENDTKHYNLSLVDDAVSGHTWHNNNYVMAGGSAISYYDILSVSRTLELFPHCLRKPSINRFTIPLLY